MLTQVTTVKTFVVFNHNDDQFYNIELEIDHNNFDEESILITNEDGFAIDNDKFNEVEKIFEEFYNYNDDFIDEDE
jgi:hypothetical protein